MKKPPKRRWLKALSLLNIAWVVTDWVLVTVVSDSTQPTAILSTLPQVPFLVPSALLLVVCAFTFRWRLLLGNLVAVVPFAWPLLGLQFHPVPPASNSRPLRVVTYNIHHASAGWDAVARTVLDQHPDLFCLQEAVGTDMGRLRQQFPGYELLHRGEFVLGSKSPFTDAQFRAGRGAEAPTLQARTMGITLQTTHLASFDNWRKLARPNRRVLGKTSRVLAYHVEEAEDIVRFDESLSPLILCGDFNAPPRGSAYRTFRSAFIDAFDVAGNGFGYTHPSVLPIQRIDNIWCRGVVATDCHPVWSGDSDHLPLVATITSTKP